MFGYLGVMELQEGKRERQGIQAFISFIIGPTIKKFFVFVFLYLVVANRPLLQFSDLVLKLRHKGKAKSEVNCITNLVPWWLK